MFDARGRTTQVTYPAFGGEPARTVTSVYAVSGNPLRVESTSDPAGTITTTVDLFGRTVGYQDVWGTVTAITYDQAGQMTAQTSPGEPSPTRTTAAESSHRSSAAGR